MTREEINRFIDSMTWEDYAVRLYDRLYWCIGLCYNPALSKYSIYVFEADWQTYNSIRDLFAYSSSSRDDCMKHFLEDKYWDGKSFYEVAPDLEWIDL